MRLGHDTARRCSRTTISALPEVLCARAFSRGSLALVVGLRVLRMLRFSDGERETESEIERRSALNRLRLLPLAAASPLSPWMSVTSVTVAVPQDKTGIALVVVPNPDLHEPLRD